MSRVVACARLPRAGTTVPAFFVHVVRSSGNGRAQVVEWRGHGRGEAHKQAAPETAHGRGTAPVGTPTHAARAHPLRGVSGGGRARAAQRDARGDTAPVAFAGPLRWILHSRGGQGDRAEALCTRPSEARG